MSHYPVTTIGERLVSEYSGLNFVQIEDLPIDTYLLLMRDAFIYKQSQSEGGREYLNNCWRIEQTEPDKQALRKKFKKEGSGNGKQYHN